MIKSKPIPQIFMILGMLLTGFYVHGQNTQNSVIVNSEKVTIVLSDLKSPTAGITFTGPGDFISKTIVPTDKNIEFLNVTKSGKNISDGQYLIEIKPFYKLDEEKSAMLISARDDGDHDLLQELYKEFGITQTDYSFTQTISVKNGKFVYDKIDESYNMNPSQGQSILDNLSNLTASIQPLEMAGSLNLATDESSMLFAQVFTQDVIVQGSLCIGMDCSSSESFGADTHRFKENNLRIHFDDTSNASSFPSNDWRIVINDTSNGGASYFGIEDATSGRVPFRVEAGAPANALVVEDSGDIGIGTINPVVEVHVVDGDSPTLRLEQDGSSGFGSQTWDIAGNETNFFVRDVSNGSRLPFKIFPAAATNSLVIAANDNIGIGVQAPTQKLQIESGNLHLKAGNIGINTVPNANALAVTGNTTLTGNITVTGTTTLRGNESHFLGAAGGTYYTTAFSPFFKLDAANGRVGIGTAAPGYQLQLSLDSAAKPNGGMWTAASDRRLKKNIHDFHDGLDVILKMNPVTYNYNGKLGYPTDKTFVGVIAQEVQSVAPYMVKPLNSTGDENYLAYDGTPLTFLLVNAIKDQQKMIASQQEKIDELENKLSQIEELKAMVTLLSTKVALLASDSVADINETISEKE